MLPAGLKLWISENLDTAWNTDNPGDQTTYLGWHHHRREASSDEDEKDGRAEKILITLRISSW
jgi:hypothetical protein